MRHLLLLVPLVFGCAVEEPGDESGDDSMDVVDGKGDGLSTCSGCDVSGYCGNGVQKNECMIDPDSQWKIIAVGAVISATNDGSSWDLSSDPDPYVFCGRGTEEAGRTRVITDSRNPSWNEAACTGIGGAELMRNQISIRLYDEDDVSGDEFIGLFQARLGIDDLRNDITRTLYRSLDFGGSLSQSRVTLRFERLE